MASQNGSSQFAVYVEQDEDGVYIGSVPTIPGCHAQGNTEEEMLQSLQEVLKLCLRNTDQAELQRNKFIGIHNLELSHA